MNTHGARGGFCRDDKLVDRLRVSKLGCARCRKGARGCKTILDGLAKLRLALDLRGTNISRK